MRPAKLWTRSPLALRLIALLDLALAEGWVEATGEERSARTRSISVSWKRRGAKAWRRCHSTLIGKHAQKDMGAHTIGYPVPDRADLEIDGLHRTEGAFHAGEILVGLNRL